MLTHPPFFLIELLWSLSVADDEALPKSWDAKVAGAEALPQSRMPKGVKEFRGTVPKINKSTVN